MFTIPPEAQEDRATWGLSIIPSPRFPLTSQNTHLHRRLDLGLEEATVTTASHVPPDSTVPPPVHSGVLMDSTAGS